MIEGVDRVIPHRWGVEVFAHDQGYFSADSIRYANLFQGTKADRELYSELLRQGGFYDGQQAGQDGERE